jgi:hypothetical protein
MYSFSKCTRVGHDFVRVFTLYNEALAVWDVENEKERQTIPQFQKNWDNINIKPIIAND